MEESRETYSEVLGFLLALGNKYIKKLPSTMIPYLMENCNRNNIPKIDKNKRQENNWFRYEKNTIMFRYNN